MEKWCCCQTAWAIKLFSEDGQWNEKVHIDHMLTNNVTDNDLTEKAPLTIGILSHFKYPQLKCHPLVMILLVPVLVTMPKRGGILKDYVDL